MTVKPVKVRNLTIGEGIPKICVPLVGESKEQILEEAQALSGTSADFVEWRADCFAGVSDMEQVKEVLKMLRTELNDLPLLFTFRTASEGGKSRLEPEAHTALLEEVVQAGCADLVDIELMFGKDRVKKLVAAAHNAGLKVIISNHILKDMPSKSGLIQKMFEMQELNADILKIAVLPQMRKDVITLLAAVEEMNTKYASRPIIGIALAEMGSVSRLCGEAFGSAVTFGVVKNASAPGQIEADALSVVLHTVHKTLIKEK